MKYVFFGTPRNAARLLEKLIEAGHPPVALVCNPDRESGRKKIMTAPATKTCVAAHKLNIPVFQPEKPSEIKAELQKLGAEVFIVLAYGSIIPKEILTIPKYGTIGVHPSLLPKYRGPSPIQTALLNGDAETGVTLYQIDEKMDHGNIIAQSVYAVAPGTDNLTLEQELADLSAEMIAEAIPKYLAGRLKPVEQDHAKATITKKFTTADGQVDFIKDEPLTVYHKIKAFYPEPSVWTMNFPGHEGKRVKLLSADWHDNKIHITAIQADGKKPVRIA